MPMTLAQFLRPHSPFVRISDNDDIQDHYAECRKNGTSHRLAEMLAFQAAPAIDTEVTFISGMKRQFEDENDAYAQVVMQRARDAGVNTKGAHYCSQLADSIGDPEAWVTSKDDVKRVADKRDLRIEGSGINYTPPQRIEPDDPRPYQVAEDIVDQEFKRLPADIQNQKHSKDDLREKLSGR